MVHSRLSSSSVVSWQEVGELIDLGPEVGPETGKVEGTGSYNCTMNMEQMASSSQE